MSDFWEGFLFGLAIVGVLVAIVLPLVLTVFSAGWLFLYLIEIPIVLGILNMMS